MHMSGLAIAVLAVLAIGNTAAEAAASHPGVSGAPGPFFVHETRLEGHGGEPVSIAGAALGGSVSISGDTALVGAYGEEAA